jgi:hypothetical protein
MRRARVKDYWRGVDKSPSLVRLERLSYVDVPGIGTGSIEFTSQLNLLCGPNGVGKTTLLRSIWAALAPMDAAASPSTVSRLKGGSVCLPLMVDEVPGVRNLELAQLPTAQDYGEQFEVVHVDTSSMVGSNQELFCRFPNLQDALNGAPVYEADAEDLETLRFLTMVQYGRMKIYTVDHQGRDIPFMEVESEGVEYDSRTMGMGELAALHLWWALKNLSEKTVLLLEEPESYLSPGCQTAFAGILAKRAVQMKAFVIITTHSPAIIREAGLRNLRFLYRDGRNSLLSNPKRIEALLNGVGIETRTETILLVEDQAAAIFAGLWLSHFDPMVAIGVETHSLNGAGNISKLLASFPSDASSVRIRGLYDGDQKGNVPIEVEALAAFLPGKACLEKVYRDMLTNDVDRVEPLLGIPDLRAVLYAIRQYEDHDWFVRLATAATLTIEQLHLVLFKAWIADEVNAELAKEAFEALLKTVTPAQGQ